MEPLVWSILLLVIGLLLILVEMFVPSGGVIGILSATAIVASVVVAFMDGMRTGSIMLVSTLVIVPSLIGFAVKVWPNTPLGRRILIQLPEQADDVLPDSPQLRELKQLVGRVGRVRSPMRPSGHIEIDGQKYDATSAGMSIDAGELVVVISVRMNRIVVQPADEAHLAADASSRVPNVAASPAALADPLSRPAEELGIDPLNDPLA